MDIHCTAFTHMGKACGSVVSSNGLCKAHNNALKLHGPNTFALKQMENRHKGDLRNLLDRLNDGTYSKELYDSQRKIVIGCFEEAKAKMMMDHEAHTTWSGVDPDADANEKKLARRAVFEARREKQRAERAERHRIEAEQARRYGAYDGYGYGGYVGVIYGYNDDPVVPVERQLRDIVTDPQSVHTTEAVKQTKEIVEKVRKIPVPEGYRWDAVTCSKTPGEIITECKLSQQAALQMMQQYALDTAIYDIEEGIYGKVLDSVWQYVKASPDKAELCNIIKQEMEDNIGMCAQGNLTRICNILAGYVDGVGAAESLSEKLGRLLAPLMEIEKVWERRTLARRILMDNEVPITEWETWMAPLHA